AIHDGKDYLKITELVDGAAESEFDMASSLKAALDDDHSLEATLALCLLVDVLPERLTDTFPSAIKCSESYPRVLEWLCSDEVRQRLENACFSAVESPELKKLISDAIETLGWLK